LSERFSLEERKFKMALSRRHMMCGLTAAGAAITTAGLPAFAQEPTVTGNVNPTLNNANFLVALSKGFFREEGIRADMPVNFLDQSQLIQLLSGGQINVVHVSASPQGNNALLRGAPIRIIAGGAKLPGKDDVSASYLLVRDELYQKGVRTVADLKGHTIHLWPGVSAPSGRGATLLIEKAGLKRTDVQWSGWSNLAQLGQSYEAGTVQVAYLLEPMSTIVRDKIKSHVLGTGTEVISGTTALVLWANTRWLESSGDAPVRLLKALLRGANYYCDARDSKFAKNADVGEILATHAKINPALIQRLGLPDFSRDGNFDVKDLLAEAEFLKSTGAIKDVADFNSKSVVDLSYAQQAFSELKKEAKL
jgi:ABC-type nitrate/sulfonate/bicarbonate transport system substrate-binding protein